MLGYKNFELRFFRVIFWDFRRSSLSLLPQSTPSEVDFSLVLVDARRVNTSKFYSTDTRTSESQTWQTGFCHVGKMCVCRSCFAELTWNKSLTAREYENNFVKFYIQALKASHRKHQQKFQSQQVFAEYIGAARPSSAVVSAIYSTQRRRTEKLYLKGWRLS